MILPGIKFTAETKPADDILPRMDIAAFVGFAASGPINIPVSIEDVQQYNTIFGPDLPLLWNPEKGRMQSAYLGAAVRAFFRAGGQRCWVVRVADDQADTQWFPIPGMGGVAVTQSSIDGPVSAYIVARSPGSWADTVTVRTRLRRENFGLAKTKLLPAADKSHYKITVASQTDRRLQPHDLLQLRYPSTAVSSSDYSIGYLPVRSVQFDEAGNTTTVEGKGFVGLRICQKGCPPTRIRLPNKAAPDIKAGHWEAVENKSLYLSPPDTTPWRLTYKYDPELALPQPGAVLSVQWESASSPAQEQLGFMVIQNVVIQDQKGRKEVTLEAQEEDLWELIDANNLVNGDQSYPYVERIDFALIAEHPQIGQKSLLNLGFLDGDPRSWLNIDPDDRRFWAPDEPDARQRKINDLSAEAMQENFPLAAPDFADDVASGSSPSDKRDIDDAPIWFPLGMSESLFQIVDTRAAGDTDPDTALVRDGVQRGNRLDELFMDEDLAQTTSVTLESQAVYYRYVQNQKRPRPLKGIHSLFFIDEITLLSVPDAVHQGWSRGIPPIENPPTESNSATLLPPPAIESLSMDEDAQKIEVVWKFAGVGSVEFLFQHAADPQFLKIIEAHQITNPRIDIPFKKDCESHHYFRVHALGENRTSPWSNTAYFKARDGFTGCEDKILRAPDAAISQVDETRFYRIVWKNHENNVQYQLQASFDPLFQLANEFPPTEATQHETAPHHLKIRFYRVRAVFLAGEDKTANEEDIGQAVYSPWSNTVWLLPQPKSEWRLHSAEEYSDVAMLNIHQAMLRMARSRGDMVSILSLPEHFQSRQAINYKNRLIANSRQGEANLFSYGAIYHPWPMGLEHGANPLTVPPDGVACGVIAKRSIHRGAWVAPANIVLQDVVGLAQTYNRLETVRLFEAQINLLTTDSRGTVVFNAATLSEDEELKLLNVRRLLILLRRLAIREGMETTFDPNDESTRRLIERIFERTLTGLYTRGAFAGNTPDQAFRVIVNESNNTRQSIDQGRLVVDLKVAPSQPLKFLTIRLIQGDGEGGRVEEI